jgi:hypothetical protein
MNINQRIGGRPYGPGEERFRQFSRANLRLSIVSILGSHLNHDVDSDADDWFLPSRNSDADGGVLPFDTPLESSSDSCSNFSQARSVMGDSFEGGTYATCSRYTRLPNRLPVTNPTCAATTAMRGVTIRSQKLRKDRWLASLPAAFRRVLRMGDSSSPVRAKAPNPSAVPGGADLRSVGSSSLYTLRMQSAASMASFRERGGLPCGPLFLPSLPSIVNVCVVVGGGGHCEYDDTSWA